MRWLLRRVLRAAIGYGPPAVRRAAQRLPYSRYSGWLRPALRGDETITWRGVPLRVDPGEAWGYALYFFRDEIDLELDWLVEQCRDGSLFVEVGAHVGIYTRTLARLFSSLRVIVFEPDAANAATIRSAVAADPSLQARVTVVQAAVGDPAATSGLRRCRASTAAWDTSPSRRAPTASTSPWSRSPSISLRQDRPPPTC